MMCTRVSVGFMWKSFVGIVVLLGVLSCGSAKDSSEQTASGTNGASSSSQNSGEAACAAMVSQKERNICLHDTLLRQPPANTAQAYQIARQIRDQVIRGAAILKWVQTHNRKIEPDEGKKLCDLLKDREKTSCVRKLYAAHLQR